MSSLKPLSRMISAVDAFRSLNSDVPATTVQVFLIIATNPGISGKDLIKRVGVSQSSISRHTSLLGEYAWNGGEGMQLIESIEDPNDRRQKVNFLTIKGRQLAMRLVQLLDPTSDHSDDPSLFPTAKEYTRQVRGAR